MMPSSLRPKRIRRAGFSLIELLTAVAVLSVLSALLAPALGAARSQAALSAETSAARQLAIAHQLHAGEHRGILLAGLQGGRPADSETGETVHPVTASRWPHHLRPYLGDRFRGTLYVNEQALYYARITAQESAFLADYTLSLAPTFGMNARFVGGDGAHLSENPVTRIDGASAPSSLIVFCAARNRTLDAEAGYFQVHAPAYWDPNGLPTDSSDPSADPRFGYVAPRFGPRVTTTRLDGSVVRTEPATLRDMRLWSDTARRADNANHRPTGNL